MTACGPPRTGRGDLLVVDDTPENLGVLSAMLKEKGFRVRAVTSGRLALTAASAQPPDLVLLDINMPQMDGYEVCRRLRADGALAGIPVIFLSALSETPDITHAFASGGVDYVTKPFRIDEVVSRIETHLAIRRLQLELEHRNEELAASYASLEELERVRQTLVSMIVHDLKSPLAAMTANISFIRREADLRGDVGDAIHDVAGLADVMSRMVLDVLDVGTADRSSLQPRLAPIDLQPFLEDVATKIRRVAQAAGKDLVVNVHPGCPRTVACDHDLLRRVIENLVDNAIKYAPAGTAVRIEAAADTDGRYALRVQDEGPGIPPPLRDKVFEPYARLDRDRTKATRTSRGLGLAFCRMAVEAHGGTISVGEAAAGRNQFEARLPAAPPTAGTAA